MIDIRKSAKVIDGCIFFLTVAMLWLFDSAFAKGGVDCLAYILIVANLMFFIMSWPISNINQTVLDILLGLRISAFLISVGYFFTTIDWIQLLDAIGK